LIEEIIMRIFELKLLKFLGTLTEARAYRPGVIHHVNGKAIKADHIQDHGAFYRVGIGPGNFKSLQYYRSTSAHNKPGDVDFWTPPIWTPWYRLAIMGRQDETGYCTPNADGKYNAKRGNHHFRKFKNILTIKKENVQSIDYQSLA